MVAIRVQDEPPRAAVDFLKYCYRFVNEEWQHVDRDDLPDQGFERNFRASCITRLGGWEISQEREMRLGYELSTASGVLHEIDIVTRHSDVTVIVELKNRQGAPVKNDMVVFFAKILDYLALNPDLLLKELRPAFMSTATFEINGRERVTFAMAQWCGLRRCGPGLFAASHGKFVGVAPAVRGAKVLEPMIIPIAVPVVKREVSPSPIGLRFFQRR